MGTSFEQPDPIDVRNRFELMRRAVDDPSLAEQVERQGIERELAAQTHDADEVADTNVAVALHLTPQFRTGAAAMDEWQRNAEEHAQTAHPSSEDMQKAA